MKLTEAEQNRLIVANIPLIEPIAARYRGAKSIPFDELTAAGRMGLMLAARESGDWRDFTAYAAGCIENEIRKFIREWDNITPVSIDAEAERDFFEWDIWKFAAPFEHWGRVVATPEELVLAYDEIGISSRELTSAMIGLTKRQRDIFAARFIAKPPRCLQQIARDHKISYAAVVKTIQRTIETLRDRVQQRLSSSREAATPTAMRG